MRNEARTEYLWTLIAVWPQRYGHPPTVRELADEIGCATTTAYHHVNKLIDAGRVTQDPGKNRTLRVTTR